MKSHTFTITVGAPDNLDTLEVCRLLNRLINSGVDVALTTEDTDDPDINLIEEMSLQDAKPMPE
jgi:hypothetical protein